MSTAWDYICRSHDAVSDLDAVRNDWGREQLDKLAVVRSVLPGLVEVLAECWLFDHLDVALYWLAEHAACDIALRNEYGDVSELTVPDA